MKKGNLLIILGVLLIAAALGMTFYNIREDKLATEAADAAVEALASEIYGNAEDDTASDAGNDADDPTQTAADGSFSDSTAGSGTSGNGIAGTDNDSIIPWTMDPDQDMPTITISGYRYIGIIEIPSKNLKLPVMEEWDYDRLKIAPCRYSGSAYQDNMVICGHNYFGHFSDVRYVSIGDEVRFTDASGNVFEYEVANIETLKPTQVEEMTTGEWDLTLFTCNAGARTRCAVRCYRQGK